MEFSSIDGSRGEGGGQILRSAITLSCITKTPIKVKNIRQKRRYPGLAAGHLAAVKILAKICNARVSGLKVGSTEIEFVPNDVQNLSLTQDVGTAASISLILQVLIYAVSLSKKKLEITIRGGTDVSWSPTIDYTRFVLSEALSKFGIRYGIDVKKRGYYPRGGGIADVKIFPCKRINPVSFTKSEAGSVSLCCTYSKIREQKVQQAFWTVKQNLQKNGFDVDSKITREDSLDCGASILAYRKSERSVLGSDGLWDVQKEKFRVDCFGKFACNSLGVDENLADMIVIPASLSNETSIFQVPRITTHLETNLYVTSKLTGCKYGIGRLADGYEVRIKGNL